MSVHDALGNVDWSCQHLWIYFMKTIILPESVVVPSIMLLWSTDLVGGNLRYVLGRIIVLEDKIALCISGSDDK